MNKWIPVLSMSMLLACATAPKPAPEAEAPAPPTRAVPLRDAAIPNQVQMAPSRLSPEAVLERASARSKSKGFKFEAPVRTTPGATVGKVIARSTRTFDPESGLSCGEVAEIMQVRVVEGSVSMVHATCYQERTHGTGHWLDQACEHTLVAECPDGGDQLIADLAADAALSL